MSLLDNSAYAGAIGTVLGAALTVLLQGIYGSRQRRHERINRLFDIKVEVYTELLSAVEAVRAAIEQMGEVARRSSELQAEFFELKERRAQNGRALLEFRDQHLTEDGPYRFGTSAEVVQQGQALAAEHAELSKRWDGLVERIQALTVPGELQTSLQSASSALHSVSPKVSLIADGRLLNETALVLQMITTGFSVGSDQVERVRRAARAEVGAGTPWVRRTTRDLLSRIRLRRFKARLDGQTTPLAQLRTTTERYQGNGPPADDVRDQESGGA